MTRIGVGLIGNPTDLDPNRLALVRAAIEDIVRYLNQDHSAVERQYLEGALSRVGGFDWFMDAAPKKDTP